MVCHFPKRLGSPRHLQPCSATYSSAFSSCRLGSFTLPRCRGRLEAICWYCASVISMRRSISQNYKLVLTRSSPGAKAWGKVEKTTSPFRDGTVRTQPLQPLREFVLPFNTE